MQGINDSKKLTEKKRDALFDEIKEKALAYRIVFVGPDIIDRNNILNATMGGMKQAVEELDIVPNLVLVDGNRVPAGLQIPAGGQGRCHQCQHRCSVHSGQGQPGSLYAGAG